MLEIMDLSRGRIVLSVQKNKGVDELCSYYADSAMPPLLKSVGCCPVYQDSNHHTPFCNILCDVASICTVRNIVASQVYKAFMLP